MIDGHHHAITFVHFAFYQALLPGLDLNDLGADLVVLSTISHEDIWHIVGYFSCEGVAILDGYDSSIESLLSQNWKNANSQPERYLGFPLPTYLCGLRGTNVPCANLLMVIHYGLPTPWV